MAVLENLEPKSVFKYFEEICNIPHPSYKEKQISDYLVSFAKEHDLEYYQDDLYNVVMIKEATPGYEDVEPVIFQGHMDMVCEKEASCDKNMDEEGLDLEVDGDYISAKGTTLGGDDGIAVAFALAILDSDEIAHPRIEFICTVSEEVGMEGAAGIDLSMIKGKKLLNLDSENEGRMCVSCAGGCTTEVTLPVKREEKKGTKLIVTVDGLVGGHSGVEIDKGRANANLLMARVLRDIIMADVSYSIISMEGGSKDNAIPRDCATAIMVADEKDADKVKEILAKVETDVRKEYASCDGDIRIFAVNEGEALEQVLTQECTKAVVTLILSLPNGIMRMSQDIENLVETSLNLGVCVLDDEKLLLRYAVRSSVGTAKENLMNQIAYVAKQQKAAVNFTGVYPAWEYNRESKLRDDMTRIFEEMFGHKPIMEAIHAGLECGILSGKIEGLDCVSLGPDMLDIHTPAERLSISSTKRMYDYVIEVIGCK